LFFRVSVLLDLKGHGRVVLSLPLLNDRLLLAFASVLHIEKQRIRQADFLAGRELARGLSLAHEAVDEVFSILHSTIQSHFFAGALFLLVGSDFDLRNL